MRNQFRLGRIKLQAHAPTDPDYLSNVRSYHVSWSPKRETRKPSLKSDCKDSNRGCIVLQKGTNWLLLLLLLLLLLFKKDIVRIEAVQRRFVVFQSFLMKSDWPV